MPNVTEMAKNAMNGIDLGIKPDVKWLTKRPKVSVIKGQAEQTIARIFNSRGWHVTSSPEWSDLVVFTGGSDVGPELYGQRRLSTTKPDALRDKGEKRIYDAVKAKGIPTVGICRGAQFTNVMNGGSMWQDVDNHGLPHAIKDLQSRQMLLATSSHHQMMRPSARATTVAVSRAATFWADDTDVIEITEDKRMWDNAEVVWYPDTKSLCYQPHPEEGTPREETYFFSLLERFFLFPQTLVEPAPFDDKLPAIGVPPFDPDPVG